MNIKVLFVCLGNICRSPTAHGLFEAAVNGAGLNHEILVDSAGTGSWHVGRPPDERARQTAIEHGYDIGHLRARQITVADFQNFDYILGMDKQNLVDLKALQPEFYRGVAGLFLEVSGVGKSLEVGDPYTGNKESFDRVIRTVQDACDGLLLRIRQDHDL
ncbi:MAG: protein-tyrosine phosphatase [Cellvibrionaceae bacterium]|jgi:protein-tyrosine phosphatase